MEMRWHHASHQGLEMHRLFVVDAGPILALQIYPNMLRHLHQRMYAILSIIKYNYLKVLHIGRLLALSHLVVLARHYQELIALRCMLLKALAEVPFIGLFGDFFALDIGP